MMAPIPRLRVKKACPMAIKTPFAVILLKSGVKQERSP